MNKVCRDLVVVRVLPRREAKSSPVLQGTPAVGRDLMCGRNFSGPRSRVGTDIAILENLSNICEFCPFSLHGLAGLLFFPLALALETVHIKLETLRLKSTKLYFPKQCLH